MRRFARRPVDAVTGRLRFAPRAIAATRIARRRVGRRGGTRRSLRRAHAIVGVQKAASIIAITSARIGLA
jgi:hypothetical protein